MSIAQITSSRACNLCGYCTSVDCIDGKQGWCNSHRIVLVQQTSSKAPEHILDEVVCTVTYCYCKHANMQPYKTTTKRADVTSYALMPFCKCLCLRKVHATSQSVPFLC